MHTKIGNMLTMVINDLFWWNQFGVTYFWATQNVPHPKTEIILRTKKQGSPSWWYDDRRICRKKAIHNEDLGAIGTVSVFRCLASWWVFWYRWGRWGVKVGLRQCVFVSVCVCVLCFCVSEWVCFFYLHFACLCFCKSPLAEEKEGLVNTWASVFVKIKLGCDLKCGCWW